VVQVKSIDVCVKLVSKILLFCKKKTVCFVSEVEALCSF